MTDKAKDEDRAQCKQEATGQHSFLHAEDPPFVWKGVLQASLDVHVTGILYTNVEKSMHRSIPIHVAPPEEEAIRQ